LKSSDLNCGNRNQNQRNALNDQSRTINPACPIPIPGWPVRFGEFPTGHGHGATAGELPSPVLHSCSLVPCLLRPPVKMHCLPSRLFSPHREKGETESERDMGKGHVLPSWCCRCVPGPRHHATPGALPAPGRPRLRFEVTFINTEVDHALVVASGARRRHPPVVHTRRAGRRGRPQGHEQQARGRLVAPHARLPHRADMVTAVLGLHAQDSRADGLCIACMVGLDGFLTHL
jgi:hypothetical protein